MTKKNFLQNFAKNVNKKWNLNKPTPAVEVMEMDEYKPVLHIDENFPVEDYSVGDKVALKIKGVVTRVEERRNLEGDPMRSGCIEIDEIETISKKKGEAEYAEETSEG